MVPLPNPHSLRQLNRNLELYLLTLSIGNYCEMFPLKLS